MASVARETKADKDIVSKSFGESDIQRFYAGKTVLITGTTGYMGLCLVEKLLRGCPDLKRIYMLVRPKRGKTAVERIATYFDDTLFDTLRGMGTDFKSKVSMIVGDLMLDDMALSKNDKETIIEEVNIIFHNASNVKFMERTSKALKINVMGTKAMIDMAKQCKHIEGFMYVSTAYSHCNHKHIMEVAYPSPASMKLVEDMIAADLASPTGLSSAALSDILGEFPNTYIFTKAIAEGLVNDAGKESSFPFIVYRPSIVLSTWKEPVRGWCGNLNGPGLLFTAVALGIVHVALVAPTSSDFIPVDMSINSMLVSMWDAVKERSYGSGAVVYNYGSSTVKPISIQRLGEYCTSGNKLPTPSIHTLWKDFLYYTTSIWKFAILHILFHFLPAIVIDSYLLVTGKKPRALSALKHVTMSNSGLTYFALREWKIDITEMTKAVDRMSTIDRELFFCDLRKLDWYDYLLDYWKGLRVYGLKDPISTVPAAERKLRIITPLHYIGKYTILLLIVYATLRFLGLLWILNF